MFQAVLFGGEASEEDISNALDGSSDSTSAEQEIRDCFAPLYNTGGGTTGTTSTAGSSSADETDDSSPSENEEDSSINSETSDNGERSSE